MSCVVNGRAADSKQRIAGAFAHGSFAECSEPERSMTAENGPNLSGIVWMNKTHPGPAGFVLHSSARIATHVAVRRRTVT